MTDAENEEERKALALAKLNAAGAILMTAEEILSGQLQAGVPRPAFLKDHQDDGTVEKVTRHE